MSNTVSPVSSDVELAESLLERARAEGITLSGPGGLLASLAKTVIEAGLEAEMTQHLGHSKGESAGNEAGNHRNGSRAKTVLTDVGPVDVAVLRDRLSSFDPMMVKKRQRRLSGVDQMVLALSSKGLTTGEISAYLAEIYGAQVSKDTISAITDGVLEQMNEWRARPLDPVYPVLFIDCIHVKIRDGQVGNRPMYVAIGVTVAGQRDIIGLWAGDGGESAKYWLQVLTEIKNRGVADCCIVVCDGLKGLPETINTCWPQALVQTCVLHLIRNTFRFASRHDWDQMARDLRPVYTAATEAAAKDRFGEFAATWGSKYPAAIRLWETAWAEFVPFLQFDVNIRRVICSTNAIESINARFRRAVRARGHFPTEAAALKCLYLTVLMAHPRHTIPRPHRQRQRPVDKPLERSTQRIRDNIRRKNRPSRDSKLTN